MERVEILEGESVLDIEITSNRVDSLSIMGIAREAATILPEYQIPASCQQIQVLPLTSWKTPAHSLPLPTIENLPAVCRRILAVVLDGVHHTPTPDWMAKRLRQIGENVHDSSIDITNYLTHELGHPCHAFDYDKIMKLGGQILIKVAKKGKTFVTLDGLTYQTVGGEVVFENANGDIIDLPAVKGTLNTSIDESTRRVLFWIESLDPQKVRWASMSHAIRTVAAQLNEKGVDPNLADAVMARGIKYYRDLCRARVASPIFDDFSGKFSPPTIKLTAKRIKDYLGLSLPLEKIQPILQKLGCQITVEYQYARDFRLLVTPPTFRPDLQIPVDLIEEIARIYGYHRLPSTLMATAIPTITPPDVNFGLENRVLRLLSHLGGQEVYTFSLVGPELVAKSSWVANEHLRLQNPLTEDRIYLRRTLLPSLMEVFDQNSQRLDLTVFELAHIYHPVKGKLPQERLMLSLAAKSNYRQLVGYLEILCRELFIDNWRVTPLPSALPPFEQSGQIMINNQSIGVIGIMLSGLVGWEIDWLNLLTQSHQHPSYQSIPQTSPLIEDLTFTLRPATLVGEVMTAIKKLDPIIYRLELSEIYQQNYTFHLTYLNPQRHLASAEIEPVRRLIVKSLQQQFGAVLVGHL